MIVTLIHFALLAVTAIFYSSAKTTGKVKDFTFFIIGCSAYLSFWFYLALKFIERFTT